MRHDSNNANVPNDNGVAHLSRLIRAGTIPCASCFRIPCGRYNCLVKLFLHVCTTVSQKRRCKPTSSYRSGCCASQYLHRPPLMPKLASHSGVPHLILEVVCLIFVLSKFSGSVVGIVAGLAAEFSGMNRRLTVLHVTIAVRR